MHGRNPDTNAVSIPNADATCTNAHSDASCANPHADSYSPRAHPNANTSSSDHANPDPNSDSSGAGHQPLHPYASAAR